MLSGTQSRTLKRRDTRLLLLVALVMALPLANATAQVHGIPPSVTSIQFHTPPFLPNIRPSVTSLGTYGYGHIPSAYGPYRNRNGYGYRNAYGYSTGAWIAPYYIPAYDASYGYDAGGGAPYMYSGAQAEQTLHIVVDLPPAKRSFVEDDKDGPPPAIASKSNSNGNAADAKPIDPTVLKFLQFVISSKGQKQLAPMGFVPLPLDVLIMNRKRLEH